MTRSSSTRSNAASEGASGRFPRIWAVFVPLGLLGLYLHFFTHSSGDATLRLGRLMYVLIPDQVLYSWAGGDHLEFGIGDRAPVLGWAAAWLAASWAAGHLLLRAAGMDAKFGRACSVGERTVWESVAGLSAMSTATLALGLAGMLHAWLFRTMAAALVVAAVASRFAWQRRQAGDAKHPSIQTSSAAGPSSWRLPVLLLLAPWAVLFLLAACMPPFEFDVVAYHLQAPKEWHAAGRIAFMPHNVYGNMPLGAEMHPLATMTLAGKENWFIGAIAGKVVMAAHVLLTALGLWAAGRHFLNDTAGTLGAFLFLTVPWTFRSGSIGHNEMVIACYAFFGWFATARWMETRQLSWAALAGWFCGAAAACKYTAVAFVVAPLWLSVLFWPRDAPPWRVRLRAAGLMALAGLLVGGLWYGKNVVQTGNPVFPLAYSQFGGRGWDEEKSHRWKAAHFANGHSFAQWTEKAASLGWRREGQAAFLLPLMIVSLLPFGWPRRDELSASESQLSLAMVRWWLAAVLAAVGCLWWGVTHRLDRFLLPLLPLAVVLAAGAAAALASRGRFARWGIGAVLAVSWLLAMAPAAVTPDFFFFASYASLRQAPHRVHPTHLLVNASDMIPSGKRLLVVADAQVFNIEKPLLYSSCFNDSPLEPLVRDKTASERRAALAEAGVSHVFVHWAELSRYREPGNYGFSAYITRELFAELVDQNVLAEVVPNTLRAEDHQAEMATLFRVLE